MDRDSFIVGINKDSFIDVYEGIVKNVETKFDTLSYKVKIPLPQEKTKKLLD